MKLSHKPFEKSLKKYFVNLDVNSVSHNKKFGHIVKPLFSNKIKAKTTSSK